MNTISPSATTESVDLKRSLNISIKNLVNFFNTESVDLKRSLNISTNQEARSNSAHQARAKLIEKYIEDGDDSALDKLILLNKRTKAENTPLTDKQRQVLQNGLKASKESAANARESVGANPGKIKAINTLEKRVNTIYGVAINQSVEKP